MMYPILCKVKYESMHKLLSQRDMWKQIIFSVIINWIVAPFLMVGPLPVTPASSFSGHRELTMDSLARSSVGFSPG